MGSALPELPRLVPEKHRWTKSKTNPSVMQRRALGAEAIVGMEKPNSRGQYDLYMLATLRSTQNAAAISLSLAHLQEKLVRALVAVRFQHPDCACSAAWDEEVCPIIQYEAPKSNEDALAWARDSIQIRTTSKTAFQIRTEIEEGRLREQYGSKQSKPSKSVVIYLLSDVPTEHSSLTAGSPVHLLFHMNHLFFDGMCARMFVGDLLRELSKSIDNNIPVQEEIDYAWGKEVANLGVPLLDALKLDVNTLGEDYDIASDLYVKSLYGTYGGRGLPFKHGLGMPLTDFFTFTVADSLAIIRAMKTRLGAKYTISHLVQAAIILAMLEMNPPTDLTDNDVFVTPMSVNGRPWLRDDLKDKYYTMCQTGAVIRIERIKSLLISKNDDKDKIVDALKKACIDVKNSFDKWLNNPHQLALGIAVHTLEANFLTSNPMPFKEVAAPWFISDGKNDRFIPRDLVSSTSGETLMIVDNFLFFLNQCLPYLAIRLESWRDASTLSVCYNEAHYDPATAKSFLDSVAYYMLVFAKGY